MKSITSFVKNQYLYILSFFIVLIAFQVSYGLAIIIPTNINWLMSAYHDWGQHYLGWAFYRDAPWSFPLGEMHNYFYPVGTNVGFTDSIPLLALFFKLFSSLLPDDFQYIGFWIFLSFVLNTYYTIKILKLYKIHNIIILGAVILIVTNPVFIFRGLHPALTAHWLILASFYYYLVPTTKVNASSNNRKLIFLFILSSLIHPYLAATVAGFNILVPLKNYVYEKSISLKQVILFPTIAYTSGLLIWFILGLIKFNGSTNLDVGNIYGMYSFNLNSFFNSYGFYSHFLPTLNEVSSRQYEGFGYLGVGLILLILIAFIYFFVLLLKGGIKKQIMYLSPLVIVSFLYLLFAITNQISLGSKILFDFPIPSLVLKLGNIFRASGRFSWPFYYVLIIFSIIVFSKIKINQYIKIILYFSIISLQIYDIENLLTSRNLKPGAFNTKLDDERWIQIFSQFDEIISYPPFTNNLVYKMDYQDLMFLAQKSKKPMTNGYVAREDVSASRAYKQNLKNTLKEGLINPNSLFVTSIEHLDDFDVLLYKNKVTIKKQNGFIFIYPRNKKIDFFEKDDTSVDDILSDFSISDKIEAINTRINNYSKISKEKCIDDATINFNIEKYIYNSDNKILQIKGWAFIKDQNTAENDSIFISFTSKDSIYLFPSTRIIRKDVTAHFNEKNHDNSGFDALLFLDALPIGNHKVGLVIKNDVLSYKDINKAIAIKTSKFKIPRKILQLPQQGTLTSNIENVLDKDSYYDLSGWAIIKKVDSKNSKIEIVLTSKNDYLLFETNPIERPDVTKFINDGYNYNYSGFSLKISKEYLNGEYNIGIIITNKKDNTSVYKPLNKKIIALTN